MSQRIQVDTESIQMGNLCKAWSALDRCGKWKIVVEC